MCDEEQNTGAYMFKWWLFQTSANLANVKEDDSVQLVEMSTTMQIISITECNSGLSLKKQKNEQYCSESLFFGNH